MIDTVLAPDIDFTGTMKFSKSLMIKGKFEGDIESTGHLIVGPGAITNATVKATVITNYGTINGNVTAAERLELVNHAKLTGDVVTPEFIIESGCTFNGRSPMVAQPKPEKLQVNPQNNLKSNKKSPFRGAFFYHSRRKRLFSR
jgi:cytoskeletal protein CcmA (bactofilin family)